MLLGGDEIARTQGGNNNGWCQDSEISWFDWDVGERERHQFDFTKRLIALRREHPVFHRRDFLTGEDPAGSGLPDAWWFRPADGRRMTQHDWSEGAKCLGVFLNGDGIAAPGPEGEKVEDDSFLLLFNACPDDCEFTLPSRRFGARWSIVFDTAATGERDASRTVAAGETLTLVHRSLVLARRVSR